MPSGRGRPPLGRPCWRLRCVAKASSALRELSVASPFALIEAALRMGPGLPLCGRCAVSEISGPACFALASECLLLAAALPALADSQPSADGQLMPSSTIGNAVR
jgi:hypothetical protein